MSGTIFPLVELSISQCPLKVHVDRYKHSIFTRCSDPFLKAIVCLDHSIARFHACERHDRCPLINFPPNTKSVVYVNPVDMSTDRWEVYQKEMKHRLLAGEVITNLVSRVTH
jgi:hypothetical protein